MTCTVCKLFSREQKQNVNEEGHPYSLARVHVLFGENLLALEVVFGSRDFAQGGYARIGHGAIVLRVGRDKGNDDQLQQHQRHHHPNHHLLP